MIKSSLNFLFDIFASLRLALTLLITLAVTLAVGTIIESLHGAKAAQQVIYLSPWFGVLLGLLALNVACAALDRLPWKRKHIGFVMTHTGIILILVGSWMTQQFAIDGNLGLGEGERGARLMLDEPVLHLVLPDLKQGTLIPIAPTPFKWEGKRPIDLPDNIGLEANLLAYYPHAAEYKEALADEGGQPLAEVIVSNKMVNTGGWLIADSPEQSSVNLGPAIISFSSQALTNAPTTTGKGSLHIDLANQHFTVSIDTALEDFQSLEGTAYALKVSRYLPHAVVEDNQLINRSEKAINPACEVVITGNGTEEAHTVFAFFPDFPTIHGMEASPLGIKLRFDAPQQGLSSGQNELRVIYNESLGLSYQIKTKGVIQEPQPLIVGDVRNTGWMDLAFEVNAFHPKGRIAKGYHAKRMPTGGKAPMPAALIEFRKGDEAKQIWFAQGNREVFYLAGVPYTVIYGTRTIPLGFELELKDFMIDYYEGTTRPMSYKSQVVLEDEKEGLTQRALISMNEPLEYKGFKIYQSGYQLGEQGEPDVSIFSIGRDPGIPVKYTGSIIMILGIIIMFYLKRFSHKKAVTAGKSS